MSFISVDTGENFCDSVKSWLLGTNENGYHADSSICICDAKLPGQTTYFSGIFNLWYLNYETKSMLVIKNLWKSDKFYLVVQYWIRNSLFTPPTRTRHDSQDCLVLSVSAVWTQLEKIQDSFVLYRPSFQFSSYQNSVVLNIWDWTVANWKLGRNKTKLVLSPILFIITPPSQTRHDKTVLFVLSVSAVWTSYNEKLSYRRDIARRPL